MTDRYLDCISVENMRESDRLTIENYVSGRTLMYRAALGVYRAIKWRGDIAIAVGGGNNGGDGYALACILTQDHHPCRIIKLSEKLTGDSAYFARWARALGVPVDTYSFGAFKGADMAVDCLLGTGFQGSLREPFLSAVNEINKSGAQVISVDINSGMNGDTGIAQTAVKSDVTVTIGYVKRGLITKTAALYMKKLIVADIGIVLAKQEDHICPDDKCADIDDGSLIPAPSYLQTVPIDVSRGELNETIHGEQSMVKINKTRLINRINALGNIGIDQEGRRTRLAADNADKAGRDLICDWMRQAGLSVVTDYIGNIFGIWETEENKNEMAVMTGSHIDTVVNAGKFDGCYGLLAGIEVIQSLKEAGVKTARPMAVAAFTNEEGVRYSPDMMGSLVYAGGMTAKEACETVGIDGTILGEELKRIGYAGTVEPGFLKPYAFVELHIEQGPILDAQGYDIGAVENLQGISWQKITIEGAQNHAGTTPVSYRRDAGLAAAKVITFMRERCLLSKGKTVATTGCIEFHPNAINVIPEKAVFTVDVRNPDEQALKAEENALADYLKELEKTDRVKISAERLSRFEPVVFDSRIVEMIEKHSAEHGLRCRRITSGAGQDAQNMALICPTAMIFCPSVNGVSHNPKEFTKEKDIISCAEVYMDVLCELACAEIHRT